jgi:hypothetical protein
MHFKAEKATLQPISGAINGAPARLSGTKSPAPIPHLCRTCEGVFAKGAFIGKLYDV